MTQAEPVRSKVIPVLVAALLCDAAVAEPASGKKSLIGIFDRVWSMAYPMGRPLTIYWKIADAEGHYYVQVRVVHAEANEVMGEFKAEIDVPDRLVAYDFFVEFPPVPIPEPGRYEFQIFMNDTYVGRAVLDAMRLDQVGPKS